MLGLAYDKSWRIGDKRGRSGIIQKNNGWVLTSKVSSSAPLEDHISDLLVRLADHTDAIREISRRDEVELSCVIHAAHPPPLNFSKDLVHNLSQLGASLDIDLYLTGDEG